MNILKNSFVGFVVAGDGGLDYCVEACLALIEGGVDILEIGFPFSDPLADGPTIQAGAERALSLGTCANTVLEIARRIRVKHHTPLVLFTYYNPLLQQGDGYLHALKAAGFDAVLVVDLPAPTDPGSHPYFKTLKAAGLKAIFVISPSTDDKRVAHIASCAQGFLYYACQKGTTGKRHALPSDLSAQIQRIRAVSQLPIAIGFGIGDARAAQEACEQGDAFVVGSAIVELMGQQVAPDILRAFAQGFSTDAHIIYS